MPRAALRDMTSVLQRPPSTIEREDVVVLEHTTADELAAIQEAWPRFERVTGLRGRRMYARADENAGTYTLCTPLRADDDPEQLALSVGTLPGGRYLRGVLAGEPSEIYADIGTGMAEIRAQADEDTARPLVEFYRRHNQVELWVPVKA